MKRRCVVFLCLWIVVLETTAIEITFSQNAQGATGNGQGNKATVEQTIAKANEMFKRIEALTNAVKNQRNGARTPREFTGIWGLPNPGSKSAIDKIHSEAKLTAGIKITVESLFIATTSSTGSGNTVVITKAPGINGKKQDFVKYDHQQQQIWFFDGFYSMTDENARAAMLIKSLMMGYGLKDRFRVQNGQWSTDKPNLNGQAGQKRQGGTLKTVVYRNPAYQEMLNQGPSVTVYCAEAYRAAALAVMKDRKLKLMTPQGLQGAQGGSSRGRGRGRGGSYMGGRRGRGRGR
ncbi:hypothetical protein CVT24_012100 [Panaeolus cyanescens]|uniref:Uncharacterized protein n=1 Tax=Panaeolus cyanescens TaxID=181874 RepID=A0A409WDQ4_9AGAR|nr:hypothetical protein CVT24_012100 [Panaeolus cyanescens]